MTYSLTRFAIYETFRDKMTRGSQGPPPFYQKVLLGAVSGEYQPSGWRGVQGLPTVICLPLLLLLQAALEASWGPLPTW